MKSATVIFALISMTTSLVAGSEYPSMGPDIFDTKVKAETLIERSIEQATREGKNILLLFGANWCPWCRRLHRVLSTVPSVQGRLRAKFVLVFVDANTRYDKHRNAAVIAKYGNPVQNGLPAFVLLDSHGHQMATRETESLAADTDTAVAERLVVFLDESTNTRR